MLRKKIFTPGPTQVHPDVLTASVYGYSYHRSNEFREFHKGLLSKLKQVFLTENNLHVLTTSGTGAMEAACVNFCRPGDRILFLNQGKFGARWGAICKTLGLETESIEVPLGEAISACELGKVELGKFAAIFLTQSETSTATFTDIKSLASFIRSRSNALVIVDAITSIGAIEFRMDGWGIDVAVSASQKGLMTPPGLAVIAYNEKAAKVLINNPMPRYYFDLRKEKESQKVFQTSWTPAIGVMYGLDKACEIILNEGLENRWEKTHIMADHFRKESLSIGFGLFSKCPVDSLTAITLPNGIPTGRLVSALKEKFGIHISNGQTDLGLKDKIARISHMGDLNFDDTAQLMEIMKKEFSLL